jgi:CheY-like chemotaxis protein
VRADTRDLSHLWFIRSLRGDAVCADTVVIVLTTQTNSSLRRHAIEAGADDYLLKPCSVVDLARGDQHGQRVARPFGGARPGPVPASRSGHPAGSRDPGAAGPRRAANAEGIRLSRALLVCASGVPPRSPHRRGRVDR